MKILFSVCLAAVLCAPLVAAPVTASSVNRPATASALSRPTTASVVSRPATSDAFSRPATASAVTHPQTLGTVSRPATTVTVQRPGEHEVSFGGGFSAQASPVAPSSDSAKETAQPTQQSSGSYTPSYKQAKDLTASATPQAAELNTGSTVGLGMGTAAAAQRESDFEQVAAESAQRQQAAKSLEESMFNQQTGSLGETMKKMGMGNGSDSNIRETLKKVMGE